jgi:hypothetical protein
MLRRIARLLAASLRCRRLSCRTRCVCTRLRFVNICCQLALNSHALSSSYLGHVAPLGQPRETHRYRSRRLSARPASAAHGLIASTALAYNALPTCIRSPITLCWRTVAFAASADNGHECVHKWHSHSIRTIYLYDSCGNSRYI